MMVVILRSILGLKYKIKSPAQPVKGPGITGRKLPISPKSIRSPAKMINN
jgi:hypothetical protein